MPETSDWHLYLLLAKMLGGENLQESVADANRQNCWPELLGFSSHELVTTQLYWLLKSDPSVWAQIDAESRDYLQQIFDLNSERNTELLEETSEILNALNQQGITPMLLKGTGVLLSKECPHLGYRMQLDIDFLAKPEDLEPASLVIRKMGYCYAEESKDGLQAVSEHRLPRLLKIYKQHKHLPPLLNPGKRVLVELHRHAYSKRFQKSFPITGLFDRANLVTHHGVSWYQMSAYDQIQLLLIEGYLDAGFKRSLHLPLRLARDYLDQHALASDSDKKAPAEHKFAKQILFPEELVKTILTPSQQPASEAMQKYLHKMQRAMENQNWSRLTSIYADFVRRSINVIHDPWLLRRLF